MTHEAKSPALYRPAVLLILDGFGHREARDHNAILMAKTPHLTRLEATQNYALLEASGLAVGLPPGQMGNSEVGHLNIGAGRVVYQDITRINQAIEDQTLAQNQTLKAALAMAKPSPQAGKPQASPAEESGSVQKDETDETRPQAAPSSSYSSSVSSSSISSGRGGVPGLIYDGQMQGGPAVNTGGVLKYAEDLTRTPTPQMAVRNRSWDASPSLVGLVSSGGVHSSLDHLLALLSIAQAQGVQNVWIHVITDGRDTPPHSAALYIRTLEAHCQRLGLGRIATVCGRFYAMDRDKRWERTQRYYDLLMSPQGTAATAGSALEAIAQAYERGESDEFIAPICVDPAFTGIAPGEPVIIFNFRADRMRQLTQALAQQPFTHFKRTHVMAAREVTTMTHYDDQLPLPVLFEPQTLTHTLGEVISQAGLRQLRVAESEKYAHVTYFLNGGEETPFAGEERRLIPSPRDVKTYDQKPAMSLPEVTQVAADAITSGQYALVIINFANPDMVGHTGMLAQAIEAIECVDSAIGTLIEAARSAGACLAITADHGNCETMWDNENNAPHTAHTTEPVPFYWIDPQNPNAQVTPKGALCDVAPTLLKAMNLKIPPQMSGRCLV